MRKRRKKKLVPVDLSLATASTIDDLRRAFRESILQNLESGLKLVITIQLQ